MTSSTKHPMSEREEMLAKALEQIAIVCTDNMDRDCDHRMALDFVRQVANHGLTTPAATPAWEPTPAQINSACLSYRHDFGLLPVSEAAIVKSEAKEWLRAWQKEGMGADRNEIIEQCACVVDRANREGPYQAIAAASRIRELKASTVTRPHQQEESK